MITGNHCLRIFTGNLLSSQTVLKAKNHFLEVGA